MQNIKKCPFYITAGLDDFEDKGLKRVESKAKTLKEKTTAETLTLFGNCNIKKTFRYIKKLLLALFTFKIYEE